MGIPAAGPVGIVEVEGPDGIDGDGVCVGLLIGVLPRVETSGKVRLGGAAPQEPASGRADLSFENDPLPPLINPPPPRADGTNPRGPEGGISGLVLSGLL